MKNYSVPISKEDHLFAYFLVWEVSSTASFKKTQLLYIDLYNQIEWRVRTRTNPLLLRKHGADFVFFCGRLKFYSTCGHIHVSKKHLFSSLILSSKISKMKPFISKLNCCSPLVSHFVKLGVANLT